MLRRGAATSTMAGWCNGSCGHAFLWTLAYESLGDPSHLDLAIGAASGRAYALLALHRATGDSVWLDRARTLAHCAARPSTHPSEYPHALFKGDLGLAVLAADLERPADSAMPFFEPARYRG